MEQAAVANKRLWPAMLNEPLSYEEQVKALIEKVAELDARVTVLEGEINSNEEQNG
jgi:hypothetical protein